MRDKLLKLSLNDLSELIRLLMSLLYQKHDSSHVLYQDVISSYNNPIVSDW